MGASVHSLVLGFDFSVVVQYRSYEFLGRKVPLESFIYSKNLFNVVVRDGWTTELWLHIDIAALRQTYESGKLARVGRLPGEENSADGLTKRILSKTSLYGL